MELHDSFAHGSAGDSSADGVSDAGAVVWWPGEGVYVRATTVSQTELFSQQWDADGMPLGAV